MYILFFLVSAFLLASASPCLHMYRRQKIEERELEEEVTKPLNEHWCINNYNYVYIVIHDCVIIPVLFDFLAETEVGWARDGICHPQAATGTCTWLYTVYIHVVTWLTHDCTLYILLYCTDGHMTDTWLYTVYTCTCGHMTDTWLYLFRNSWLLIFTGWKRRSKEMMKEL